MHSVNAFIFFIIFILLNALKQLKNKNNRNHYITKAKTIYETMFFM